MELDIGVFVSERHSGQNIEDADKYNLITNHSTPTPADVFPSRNGRRFQLSWLARFKWLRYSKRDNGGYCLPCVLFARSGMQPGVDPGALVSKPFVNFRRATELLSEHADRRYHKAAILSLEAFQGVMSQARPSIAHLIETASQQLIANNRAKLRSIVETVLLCGRQNISLRGHLDSSLDVEKNPTAPHGNFWALLDFRVSAGDTILRDHLAKASAHSKYTSPTIQNDIANILGDQIKQTILSRVRRAQFFSLIADEVTDSSNREQLAIVLRYVDPDDLQIREDLVEFVECDSGVTGSAIAEKITGFIQSSGLDPNKLRGQAYDGAGNMAGKAKGAAALITSHYPLALYLHCTSHSLNLAVVKSLEVQSVRNMIGVINKVSLFFQAHPKRQRKLEEAIDTTAPTSSVHKLKDLCRTRWVERIDAVQRFKDLFCSIVCCFELISTEGSSSWSADSLTDASTLLLAITTTDFVSALVITSHSLSCLKPLTKSLQAESKDIVEAVQEIDSLKQELATKREDVDSLHSEWFEEIEKLCESVNIEPSLPRLCGRQRHRDNVPAQTPAEYYRRTITIPVLDHLISEIDRRFSEHHKRALLGLNLIPSIMAQKPLNEVQKLLKPLEELYKEDLEDDSFMSELSQWYLKWKSESETHGVQALPKSLAFTVPQCSSYFSNTQILLRILCTLPVTSCSSERSFSALKRVKTNIRSTMTNQRLTSLTLLHVHHDIPVDIDKAIDDFARKYPRRLRFANILSDSTTTSS